MECNIFGNKLSPTHPNSQIKVTHFTGPVLPWLFAVIFIHPSKVQLLTHPHKTRDTLPLYYKICGGPFFLPHPRHRPLMAVGELKR